LQIRQGTQAGFTLLEILLVIVMIAITSAMIVPSIQMSGASVEDETKRLRSVLRFAMEQSQFSGVPIRWVGTKYGWHFEYLEQAEEGYAWQAYEDPPVAIYDLSDGVIIHSVEHSSEFSIGLKTKASEKKQDEEPVVGSVLLLPDGTTSQTNIKIVDEHDESIFSTLEVRPGPAGIRLKKVDE